MQGINQAFLHTEWYVDVEYIPHEQYTWVIVEMMSASETTKSWWIILIINDIRNFL